MSTIRVIPNGTAGCRVDHLPSGACLEVRTPPEYGGPGGAFSATDLLAAALASCIATSCPVHRSLADDVAVAVRFETGDGGRL